MLLEVSLATLLVLLLAEEHLLVGVRRGRAAGAAPRILTGVRGSGHLECRPERSHGQQLRLQPRLEAAEVGEASGEEHVVGEGVRGVGGELRQHELDEFGQAGLVVAHEARLEQNLRRPHELGSEVDLVPLGVVSAHLLLGPGVVLPQHGLVLRRLQVLLLTVAAPPSMLNLVVE